MKLEKWFCLNKEPRIKREMVNRFRFAISFFMLLNSMINLKIIFTTPGIKTLQAGKYGGDNNIHAFGGDRCS